MPVSHIAVECALKLDDPAVLRAAVGLCPAFNTDEASFWLVRATSCQAHKCMEALLCDPAVASHAGHRAMLVAVKRGDTAALRSLAEAGVRLYDSEHNALAEAAARGDLTMAIFLLRRIDIDLPLDQPRSWISALRAAGRSLMGKGERQQYLAQAYRRALEQGCHPIARRIAAARGFRGPWRDARSRTFDLSA